MALERSARSRNRPTISNARGAAVSLLAGFDERAAVSTLSKRSDHRALWKFKELWNTRGLAERIVRNGLHTGVNARGLGKLLTLLSKSDVAVVPDDVSIPRLIGCLEPPGPRTDWPPPRATTLRLIAERGSPNAAHARSLVSRYMKTRLRTTEELDAAFRRALRRLDPDGVVTRETIRESKAYLFN